MMRHIYVLLISTVCLFLNHAYAQCTWTNVGTGAASTVTNTAYNDIALTSADVPYITYTDASLSSAVVVKTYSAATWQQVGSLNTYSNSAYTSIAVDGTTPYVAFSDGTNGKRLLVRKYTTGAWSTVGTAVSTSTANYVSLAVHNGTPYVAYVDVANSSRATVKTFSAGAWVTVGAAVSTGTASFTSLSIDDSGVPYIIYQDVSNGSLATVKRFNGTAWIAVGTGTVSPGSVTETYIDVSYNNTPYIAYTTASNICTIKTFSASAWQSVGTGTVGSVYGSVGFALALDPAGTPYLAYYELGSYKTSVSKYNGSAWVYAGNNSLSINTPNSHGLAITTTGTPYVVFGDATSGSYVKKLGSSSAITLHPVSTPVCVGTATVMTVATNTTGVTYQWQVSTGGNVYANVLNGATYSGVTTQTLTFLNPTGALSGYLYRCVVNDGCTNLITNSATLTVNGSPAVGANSATVCAGAVATLTATNTGGLTYLWSTGATTSSIAVTSTITSIYTVTATNSFGCSTVRTPTVTVRPSKTISGNVTSSAGAVSGNMILYKYSPVLSKWDSVAFTPFSSVYSFGTVDSSSYVVQAVPTSTTNVLVTYGTSAVSWKGATTITHGCTNNASHNVNIIALTNIGTGPGSMSGKIVEGQGFVQRTAAPYSPGQPIGGIVVKGGRNPGGSMFAQTTTAADGTYTLSGIPNNIPGESYFLLVDIPGLDTNQTYHKILNVGNNQYGNLDFTVDSARINPVPYVVGVNHLDAAAYDITVFPNPSKSKVTITYALQENASVTIDIIDLPGKTVKTVLSNEVQAPRNYAIPVNTSDLTSGIYFIRIGIGHSQSTIKLFITD